MSAAEPTLNDEVRTLYLDHHGWLHGWLRRRLANAGQAGYAADLAHDTFVRLLAREKPIAAREPRAFLATVARGLVANFHRRQALESAYQQALAALPEAEAPDPQTRALLLETLAELDRRLHALPAAVRRAFLLFQLDGMPQAAIAGELRVSVATVQRYIVRALHQCCFPA
ncbi:sigma-70 family RNA polymerase sigma factor [Cupriavidus neocaledonicus]|uniref:RNA polymerase, sigma 19 factor KpLE2 phage-like element n=1 Tax=Cupriavidus neocaledonicus TaxID=1040979 RepID=A0A375HT97_9BURK|nr:sigma-70 family RNA polymerase sigma factor [Cupriavidus neocaledonicus]SOZ38438.1 RNA polymerase, sigma 19 factor; KpLE2 phage-like element [Cupriavidus neocaledonicus]SPD59970.1 RNA polymerase, sigma 19 factor; KpLE2 phage-like element [Cupriavidus neocaledonicus]